MDTRTGGEIRAVFFDLDNTLYNFNRWDSEGRRRADAFGVRELGMEPGEMNRLYVESMHAYPKRLGVNNPAIHSRVLRFKDILERRGLPVHPFAMRLTQMYWDTFLEHMQPEPGISELLDALRERGIIIGLGTNMTALIQFMKLEKLGLCGKIDHIITSEEVGYEKPDERFFSYCLSAAGVSAEECVFIGDDLDRDIPTPAKMGMHAVWYTGVVGLDGGSGQGWIVESENKVEDPEKMENRIDDYRDCLQDGKVRLGCIQLG